jgi:hypothetical protein
MHPKLRTLLVWLLVATAASTITVVALRRRSSDSTRALESLANMSDAQRQKIETKFEQVMTKGTYPILAAHTSRARFILSTYDEQSSEVFKKECAVALAEYMDVSAQALKDFQLHSLHDLIEKERSKVAMHERRDTQQWR